MKNIAVTFVAAALTVALIQLSLLISVQWAFTLAFAAAITIIQGLLTAIVDTFVL